MSKRTKFSIIFIISSIVFSFVAFLMSLNMTRNFDSEKLESEKISVEELVIIETREGKKYWEVYATKGNYEKVGDRLILKNVLGNFYQDENIVMSFKAPSGKFNSRLKEIILSGGAQVASGKDTYLSANKIAWSDKNEEIRAFGNVKMIKANEIITFSDSSIINSAFTSFKIKGNSKTELYRNN